MRGVARGIPDNYTNSISGEIHFIRYVPHLVGGISSFIESLHVEF